MALSKEVIDAINSFNGLSQRLGVGQVISDAIDNNTHNNVQNITNVVETPKIAHHDKLEGAVTVAALKSAYNSLIDDLIKAGLMEE
mgnify:CR=1 FL=1